MTLHCISVNVRTVPYVVQCLTSYSALHRTVPYVVQCLTSYSALHRTVPYVVPHKDLRTIRQADSNAPQRGDTRAFTVFLLNVCRHTAASVALHNQRQTVRPRIKRHSQFLESEEKERLRPMSSVRNRSLIQSWAISVRSKFSLAEPWNACVSGLQSKVI